MNKTTKQDKQSKEHQRRVQDAIQLANDIAIKDALEFVRKLKEQGRIK